MSWKPNKIQHDESVSEVTKNINRAREMRRDDDVVKDFSISLLNIDEVIMDHLNGKLDLHVIENGTDKVKVPILYASPERWKAVRNDGFLRDKKGKIQVPLIMYKRTGITNNDSLMKLNRNILYQPFIKGYSEKNKYDQFSVLTNMHPVKEIYNVNLPDHVIVTYDCIIWTEYIEQNNSLLEAINYSQNSYWGGEKTKFRFQAKISDYTNTIEVPADSDRLIRSNFSISVMAYLLPKSDSLKSTTQKGLTIRKLVFGVEVDTGVDRYAPMDVFSLRNQRGGGVISLGGSHYKQPSQNSGDLTTLSNFLGKNVTKIGSFVSNDDGNGNSVVNFLNTNLLNTPPELTGAIADKDKFMVYINGQHINKNIYSIEILPNDILIRFNNSLLKYSLEADDEIIAVGKFL